MQSASETTYLYVDLKKIKRHLDAKHRKDFIDKRIEKNELHENFTSHFQINNFEVKCKRCNKIISFDLTSKLGNHLNTMHADILSVKKNDVGFR